MREELMAVNEYEEVIAIPLISDRGSLVAAKPLIKGVFDALAGKFIDPTMASRIPKLEQIRRATPDDFLLICFATHGFVAEKGKFYLFPCDIGADAKSPSSFADRLISSDELSEWLLNVDAGPMVMLVDACYSARSVEREGFKPGPMGDRGLGQLAFNKRMRILAASQADDVAREPGKLAQGLLTYALIRDGIESGQADRLPVDGRITMTEWLTYGASRVPSLHEAIMSGRTLDPDRGIRPFEQRAVVARSQVPALFDFGRSHHDLVISER